jgi:hypothetical protein
MGKDEHFKKNWEEFLRNNVIERISIEDVARMFYEFGFSKGMISNYNDDANHTDQDCEGGENE